ncbi:MAG: uracil-DNA glycosylase [Azovibrio sp.]|uniref:uracil-DNA glycosylase n=1 Tax=Azovibrio sp. TaxID=1872673 RepID=UPI003C74002E
MNPKQRIILQEMGFQLWELRSGPAAGGTQAPAAPRPAVEPAFARAAGVTPAAASRTAVASMDWAQLAQAVQDCRACELCMHRHQAVLGVGDQQADWLFVGEGPGAEEDARGEPFVGQAGKLLDAMLAAIDLRRGENVYITNAVKCRPEGNRTPHAEELAACKPYLLRQIALLQPRLIVLLGKAAVHGVLGGGDSLAALRLKRHALGEIPVLVTYHPAYLLRNLPEKAKAWEDLCFARRAIQGGGGN